MATLCPPPLEPFYNIEQPKPSLNHEPHFEKETFNNEIFNNMLSQFESHVDERELDEQESKEHKLDDHNQINQSHDNDSLPPATDTENTATTDDHIKYHKTTTINPNWTPQIQAMHRANNK